MRDITLRGFSELTRIDDALRIFFNEVVVKRLSSEYVPLLDSLDRILAEGIVVPYDVPNFDRAAVDGYAVRAKDTYGVSSINPLVINVIASSEIGFLPRVSVENQQAVKIATGAPLPDGADAIIMVEHTEQIGEDKIEIYRAVTPGENVSAKGEDVKKGEKILSEGVIIQPSDIGMLSALGMKNIKVIRKPSVAVLSTGNELIEPGDMMPIGKVIDSNRPTVIAMIKSNGGDPIDLGIVSDDFLAIKSKLFEGLSADMIVVSGATSVGEKDFVPEAVNSIGRPGIIVHGISMRPGRPTALAAVNDKPVILLPGFPVAAIIAFEVFVKPILMRMLGVSSGHMTRQTIRARVSRRVASSLGNRTFARVIISKDKGVYIVEPLRTSGSGVISSIVKANGLVIIPENKEGLEEGEDVEVMLLRPLEG